MAMLHQQQQVRQQLAATDVAARAAVASGDTSAMQLGRAMDMSAATQAVLRSMGLDYRAGSGHFPASGGSGAAGLPHGAQSLPAAPRGGGVTQGGGAFFPAGSAASSFSSSGAAMYARFPFSRRPSAAVPAAAAAPVSGGGGGNVGWYQPGYWRAKYGGTSAIGRA